MNFKSLKKHVRSRWNVPFLLHEHMDVIWATCYIISSHVEKLIIDYASHNSDSLFTHHFRVTANILTTLATVERTIQRNQIAQFNEPYLPQRKNTTCVFVHMWTEGNDENTPAKKIKRFDRAIMNDYYKFAVPSSSKNLYFIPTANHSKLGQKRRTKMNHRLSTLKQRSP